MRQTQVQRYPIKVDDIYKNLRELFKGQGVTLPDVSDIEYFCSIL